MKRFFVGLMLAAAVTAGAVEVDITLKNGKTVTGGVLSQSKTEIVLLVTAANGAYHQTIPKSDIASMKDHVPDAPKVRDVARLQKSLQAAETDVRRREADIAAAQKALNDFYATHPIPSAATTDKERKLRARLTTARTQAETAQSKLNALTADVETMSRRIAEPAPATK